MSQFRLEFQWDGQGEVAWTGFADTFYRIWCNGQVLGVGPVSGTVEEPYLTRWDLSAAAVPGGNVLAIQVWTHAGRQDCHDVCALEGGLIGWLAAGEALVPTGECWLARDAVGYSMPAPDKPFRPFQEARLVLADLREEPLGWMHRDHDTSGHGWRPARIVHPQAHPHRHGLRPSPIPPLSCENQVPRLLDAGWAIGDAPVEFVRDVAIRMIRQEHESLLCPKIELGMPFKGSPAPGSPPHALGLPDPHRLGWASLDAPYACPAPGEGRDLYLTLDVGRMTSGCVRFTIETHEDCVVDIGYADCLRGRRVNPTIQFNLADRVIVPAGCSDVGLPHDRGFRYLQLTLSAAATLHEVVVEEHVFPHPGKPRFSSSDRALNAIWSSTRETLHNISLSSYVDNARRERSAWIGTELIHAWRGGYAVEGDLELARKTLCDALDFGDLMDGVVPAKALGNTPKSWLRQFDCHDLHFPRTARDYLWHSDDRELAPRLLRACERLLEHHGERTKAGLKPLVGAWSWSGWTFCAAGSVITAHNLQLVDALRATAQVFRYQGDEDSAEALLQQEEPLVEAIFRELLDGTHGVLCQGLDAEGRRVPFCSQQDNARALALGIVPEAWVERFHHFASGRSGTWPTNRSAWQGKTISGDLIRSQPEQMVVAGCQLDSLVVVEAIARLESPEAALNYIRQHWGAMVDEGPGTQWECWNQHFIEEHTSCFSQSWGTAVAFQILQFALGVEVAKPGGIEIRWKPKRVRIREISARIRTKKGEVTLGWSANELHWKVPAGVRLVIEHAESPQQTLEGPVTHNL